MGKEININIKQLLATAYGSGIVQAYALTGKDLEASNQQIRVIGDTGESSKFLFQDGDEKGEGTGLLGLPIFQQIRFIDNELPKNDPNKELYLGDSLVDITMTKTIIKTQITGMIGTIKEFICNGDYQINIKGFLVGSNPYKAPETKIRAFRTWFTDKPKALGIEGRIFELFGIENIVVESFSFPQLPTYISLRPYELNCVSDTGTLKTIELNKEK